MRFFFLLPILKSIIECLLTVFRYVFWNVFSINDKENIENEGII
jgi:hypothetical protein